MGSLLRPLHRSWESWQDLMNWEVFKEVGGRAFIQTVFGRADFSPKKAPETIKTRFPFNLIYQTSIISIPMTFSKEQLTQARGVPEAGYSFLASASTPDVLSAQNHTPLPPFGSAW